MTEAPEIEAAVAAIRAGGLAVLPTDTVYGLAASPHREAPVLALYRLKRRPARSQRCSLSSATPTSGSPLTWPGGSEWWREGAGDRVPGG